LRELYHGPLVGVCIQEDWRCYFSSVCVAVTLLHWKFVISRVHNIVGLQYYELLVILLNICQIPLPNCFLCYLELTEPMDTAELDVIQTADTAPTEVRGTNQVFPLCYICPRGMV